MTLMTEVNPGTVCVFALAALGSRTVLNELDFLNAAFKEMTVPLYFLAIFLICCISMLLRIDETKTPKTVSVVEPPVAVVQVAKAQPSVVLEEDKFCRICFDGPGVEKELELISPCKCIGSQKYIHVGCLEQWQDTICRGNGAGDKRSMECGVCKATWQYQRRGALWRRLWSSPYLVQFFQMVCIVCLWSAVICRSVCTAHEIIEK